MIVRTVLGDIPPATLGATDYHEHLFQVSPLLPGDELADETLSGQEAESLRAAGIRAMIEATPIGVGRNPAAVARISEQTGIGVVHTTGVHHERHYPVGAPLLAESAATLAARFTAEIRTGITHDGQLSFTPSGMAVRAGIVKVGVRYWSISRFENAALEAAATAAARTGAAIMVHLDHGSAAHEVLDRIEAAGASPSRVVLAHMDRNLDPGLHASLIHRGSYLGYDGMARHREAPDSAILACLAATIELSDSRHIVLGGDVARATRYRAYGGLPGLDYLPRRFVPRVEAELGATIVAHLLEANPAALLALDDGA